MAKRLDAGMHLLVTACEIYDGWSGTGEFFSSKFIIFLSWLS
jgi:hypothetical protein